MLLALDFCANPSPFIEGDRQQSMKNAENHDQGIVGVMLSQNMLYLINGRIVAHPGASHILTSKPVLSIEPGLDNVYEFTLRAYRNGYIELYYHHEGKRNLIATVANISLPMPEVSNTFVKSSNDGFVADYLPTSFDEGHFHLIIGNSADFSSFPQNEQGPQSEGLFNPAPEPRYAAQNDVNGALVPATFIDNSGDTANTNYGQGSQTKFFNITGKRF